MLSSAIICLSFSAIYHMLSPISKQFCTTLASQRAADGRKGFSDAFSAKTTSTDKIIANITKRSDFQSLLQYEELILVAVDL